MGDMGSGEPNALTAVYPADDFISHTLSPAEQPRFPVQWRTAGRQAIPAERSRACLQTILPEGFSPSRHAGFGAGKNFRARYFQEN
jgi:hypothetical protein